jgi:hypothetical protein
MKHPGQLSIKLFYGAPRCDILERRGNYDEAYKSLV